MAEDKSDIVIVGAGAAGLMAARELAKGGKRVVVLEARDRVGGRIFPLDPKEFGYPAQGGGESVHGPAPLTQALVKEAGLTFVPMEGGEMWYYDGETILRNYGAPNKNPGFSQHKDLLIEKLNTITNDMPLQRFLDESFSGAEYEEFRNSAIRMAKNFDAGDPKKISILTLRDEWLGVGEWEEGRIKEGYGPILEHLLNECRKEGVVMKLNKEVVSVVRGYDKLNIMCVDGEEYLADKCVVTLSLPTIKNIKFLPPIPEKLGAAEKIGFGDVIKVVIAFKTNWWVHALKEDLSKMTFMECEGVFTSWWTQYPLESTVLVGWIPRPDLEVINKTEDMIIELGVRSLSDIFKVTPEKVRSEIYAKKVINWPKDRFTGGGYSYSTVEAEEAAEELRKPVEGRLFFAGEALYSGDETATVEGALASGLETAQKILSE